jgi:hypothetical protein
MSETVKRVEKLKTWLGLDMKGIVINHLKIFTTRINALPRGLVLVLTITALQKEIVISSV